MSDINQLENEILTQLRRYSAEIDEGILEAAKDTSKELIVDLKASTAFKDRTGSYDKGWRLKKKGKTYIVHNKTDYQKTHLLEKGHAKRGGGRVEAKIHIAPAEDKAINTFLDRIERVIRA